MENKYWCGVYLHDPLKLQFEKYDNANQTIAKEALNLGDSVFFCQSVHVQMSTIKEFIEKSYTLHK
jgi:hypothetical protein